MTAFTTRLRQRFLHLETSNKPFFAPQNRIIVTFLAPLDRHSLLPDIPPVLVKVVTSTTGDLEFPEMSFMVEDLPNCTSRSTSA